MCLKVCSGYVMCFALWVSFLMPSVNSNTASEDNNTEYLVHISSKESVSLLRSNAGRFGLRYVERVSPNVHTFIDRKTHQRTSSELPGNTTNIDEFREFFKKEIHDIQPLVYSPLKQFRHNFVSEPPNFGTVIKKRSYFNTCSPYYGMEIEKAWVLNYTGRGVNVGILDVGLEIDHPDLQPNINTVAAYNFVDRKHRHDLMPVYDRSYHEADMIMDHCNNIAGLIVAVKGNDLCCRGVAYDSAVVPLVVFRLTNPMGWLYPAFSDKYISKALSHKKQAIQIYSNSYNNKHPFVEPKISLQDSLITGTNKGRNGKGSIFVFSLGDNVGGIHDGNMDHYANSIHTVTIGSVGRFGTVPKYAIPCACIIASTLADGKTMTANYFMTTSHRRSCTKTFKGSSAAAGIGVAVIALGLHERLSWRDVQYLLILTSSLESLKPKLPSYVNGIGLKYNLHFGFGMVNATAFALAASTWETVPKQIASVHHTDLQLRLTPILKSNRPDLRYSNIEVKRSGEMPTNVRFTEHVVVRIHYTAVRERIVSFKLYSPSNTCSVVLSDAVGTLEIPSNRTAVERTWNFTSVQFWGENPEGNWSLIMTQYDRRTNKSYADFSVNNVTLFIYGTSATPYKRATYLEPNKTVDRQASTDENNECEIRHILQNKAELVRQYNIVVVEDITKDGEQLEADILVIIVINVLLVVATILFGLKCFILFRTFYHSYLQLTHSDISVPLVRHQS